MTANKTEIQTKSVGAIVILTTTPCNASGAKGVHDLYFEFTSAQLLNFDWWKFEQ
jgi:hypothetical protein